MLRSFADGGRTAALLLVVFAFGSACGDESPAPAGRAGAGHGGSGAGTGGDAGAADDGGDAGTSGSGGGTRGGRGGSAGKAGSASGESGDAGMSGAGAGGDAGAGASGGSAGRGGASGRGGAAGGPGKPTYPMLLSETGLYADIEAEELADGVEAFHPRYELWSDGAEKQRWVKLPDGAVIDTSDPDFWSYPVGTELWKEFTVDGTRIETRLLHKQERGWAMVAYLWNDDQKDAVAVPAGEDDAKGTEHDVPSAAKCGICHDKMPDRVLGFSAIQLAHADGGVTLQSLVARDALSAPPSTNLALPGDEDAQAALGYLHTNCGICHNPQSFVSEVTDAMFWLETTQLGSVAETSTFRTTVGKEQSLAFPGADFIIAPGDPDKSAVVRRMQVREDEEQMPPVGSELVDEDGLADVVAWIQSLD